MTTFLSVDLSARPGAPVFMIASDYDTGFATLVGEQTCETMAVLAMHVKRMAEKHGAAEVLIPHTAAGTALVDLLTTDTERPFELVLIEDEEKAA